MHFNCVMYRSMEQRSLNISGRHSRLYENQLEEMCFADQINVGEGRVFMLPNLYSFWVIMQVRKCTMEKCAAVVIMK